MLFTLYLTIATYLIIRSPFIKKAGLTIRVTVLLFLLKVLAGVALGWICRNFYRANDYWLLNKDGLYEFYLLMHKPHEFFTNIFKSPYQDGYTGYFNAVGSYWNDLRYNAILKLIAFFNIFSRGNFYINSLFFNFFGFFGVVALYRVFADIYKIKKWVLVAGCFLLPSTLYYSSGLGKDLVIFSMLGFFCYALYFSITQKFTVRRGFLLFISFMMILLVRNFLAICLIPASITFVYCSKKKTKPLLAFVTIYASLFLLIFFLQILIPAFQPLKVITQRQADFLNIPAAATQLNNNVLEPTLKSFVINLPQAIDHGFLRPYLWDKNQGPVLLLAVELLFYELLFLFVIIKHRQKMSLDPFILFSLFFSISMLLITGYIIPSTGSIIRYRSIYLPFIIVPLLATVLKKEKIHYDN